MAVKTRNLVPELILDGTEEIQANLTAMIPRKKKTVVYLFYKPPASPDEEESTHILPFLRTNAIKLPATTRRIKTGQTIIIEIKKDQFKNSDWQEKWKDFIVEGKRKISFYILEIEIIDHTARGGIGAT